MCNKNLCIMPCSFVMNYASAYCILLCLMSHYVLLLFNPLVMDRHMIEQNLNKKTLNKTKKNICFIFKLFLK